jgi:hypothetical protein
MHVFYVKTRRWPTGEVLAPTESTTFSVPPGNEEKTATPFIATSPTDTLQFLFWHTGRRLTGRRTVHWSFTTMTWSVWEATKWYGVPSGGPGGQPRIHAEAFNLMTSELMGADTPISGTSGGVWPFLGNNNEVGTAGGPATISPIDSLSGLQFCGWQKLIYGGDPNPDPFFETDADVTAANVPGNGSGNVFVFTPGTTLHASAGENAEALAAYGSSGPGGGGLGLIDIIRGLDRIPWQRRPWDIIADPSPIDRIRQQLLAELLRTTQPGQGVPAGGDFNRIIESVPNMSADELKRALQSVQTQVDLGQSAVSTIEAQIKRLGKTK